jgi:hypothetical protein
MQKRSAINPDGSSGSRADARWFAALDIQRSEPGKPHGNGLQRETRGRDYHCLACSRDADRCLAERHPRQDIEFGFDDGRPDGDIKRQ